MSTEEKHTEERKVRRVEITEKGNVLELMLILFPLIAVLHH